MEKVSDTNHAYDKFDHLLAIRVPLDRLKTLVLIAGVWKCLTKRKEVIFQNVVAAAAI